MKQLHYRHIELHLTACPTFCPLYGKKVRDCGGDYSHIRGYRTTRFVTVPVEETSLIADLLSAYPGSSYKGTRTCIVSRGYDIRNADSVMHLRGRGEPFSEEEVVRALEELSARADVLIEEHQTEEERLKEELLQTQKAERKAWKDFLHLRPHQIRLHLDRGTILRIMETHEEVMEIAEEMENTNQKGSS